MAGRMDGRFPGWNHRSSSKAKALASVRKMRFILLKLAPKSRLAAAQSFAQPIRENTQPTDETCNSSSLLTFNNPGRLFFQR